ncbi:MAG: methionine biosynthesis protein MetW [Ignavibacteriaceae bacterium]|jgi:methionine biosynthesis protein MetW
MTLDDPFVNDNRKYDYSTEKKSERAEYNFISSLIEPNTKIIDLGCGNGSLLQKLIKEKNITGCGIELTKSGVDACIEKGLNVKQGSIDEEIGFPDNYFDYAICNVTIQMVLYPEILIKEMKRISKYQIVSFPNFGFYKNRFDLLLKGRMPKHMMFGYKWYNTGHIHQLSIKDFYELMENMHDLKVKYVHLASSPFFIKNYLMKKFPNLFQGLPIFLLEKII